MACTSLMQEKRATISKKLRCKNVHCICIVVALSKVMEKLKQDKLNNHIVNTYTKLGPLCGGQISPGSTGRVKDLTRGPRAQ
jgi:hypothetical protein